MVSTEQPKDQLDFENLFKSAISSEKVARKTLPMQMDFGGESWLPIYQIESPIKSYFEVSKSVIHKTKRTCRFCGFVCQEAENNGLGVILKNPHCTISEGEIVVIASDGSLKPRTINEDDLIACCHLCRPFFNLIEAGEHHGRMAFFPELSQGDISNLLRVLYMIKYYTTKGVVNLREPKFPEGDLTPHQKNNFKKEMEIFQSLKANMSVLHKLEPFTHSIWSIIEERIAYAAEIYGTVRAQDYGRVLEQCFKGAPEGSDLFYNTSEDKGQLKVSEANPERFIYEKRSDYFKGIRLIMPDMMMPYESVSSIITLDKIASAYKEAPSVFEKLINLMS